MNWQFKQLVILNSLPVIETLTNKDGYTVTQSLDQCTIKYMLHIDSTHVPTTGKFMVFPDAGHIQEMYSNHQMYCSDDILRPHHMSCINFQYCTGLISSIVSSYRTNDISCSCPHSTRHMACNASVHNY